MSGSSAKRTRQEYKVELKKQIGFLERSCGDFDDGVTDEAVRIATVVRTVIHDKSSKGKGRDSKSLLNHLNATAIKLVSVVGPPPPPDPKWKRSFSSGGLYNMVCVDGVFRPTSVLKLSGTERTIPLQDWWEADEIGFIEAHGVLTRKKLVLSAVDKDGGAHVDDALDPQYVAIGHMWKATKNGEVVRPNPMSEAAAFSIRTIAFELLSSAEFTSLIGTEHEDQSSGENPQASLS